MPNFTHQALKRVSPNAPVEPKGEPLSTRITRGKPFFRKRSLQASRLSRTFCWLNKSITKAYRLAKSRIVSGSTRVPSPVRNHPLKSKVHTSLGAEATVSLGG